jgi:hypothetical protein
MSLERLRPEVETFLEALERAQYEALSGRVPAAGVSEVYEAHPALFEPACFRLLDPPVDDSPEGRRNAHLREFLAEGIEGDRGRDLTDELLAVEGAADVQVDGSKIEYRRLPVEIRREPERGRRRRLEDARLGVVAERLTPLLRRSIEVAHEVAEELLETSYDRYCETLSGIDFDALGRETDSLLADTEGVHEDLLRWYLRRVLPGVARDDVQGHDLARLLYGPEHLGAFDGPRMVPRIGAMVEAMGLDPRAEGRIEYDLEDRPTKTARAFCSPIRVPDEIKLVLRPYGGHDDYATFLHELGHALHFGYVNRELPVEFRRLGDNGVTESHAITFDHLMLVGEFHRRIVETGDPSDYLRFAAFRELVMLRRYAAKFAYERSLHRKGPAPELAEEYVERLSRATGARIPAALYLDDVDPHFYCIRYLRAWMLSGVLHETLRERYDEDWFLNPRTGDFLRGLWARGQSEPVEALAADVGVPRLTFAPLLRMVHALV